MSDTDIFATTLASLCLRDPNAAVVAALNHWGMPGNDLVGLWEHAWIFKGRGLAQDRRAWAHAREGAEREFEVLCDYLVSHD